ncbi:ankyrin repeat domain-containing protein [Crocosphaera subtropica]|uniref:ankyrin repeat domain-containing protein n=1 Tax=Crocosphaera subtropica TaxID=2546360 RepID=UPI000A06509F
MIKKIRLNLSRIKELIAEGINVNRVDKNERFTPLLLAIKLRRKEIVKLLINAGANLYDSTYFEDNPFQARAK